MATGCRLRSGRGTPPLAPQSLATCWLTTRCEQTNRYKPCNLSNKHAVYPIVCACINLYNGDMEPTFGLPPPALEVCIARHRAAFACCMHMAQPSGC